jgi:hypothetical protein
MYGIFFLSRMLQTWGFQDKGIVCKLEHSPLPRNSTTHVKLQLFCLTNGCLFSWLLLFNTVPEEVKVRERAADTQVAEVDCICSST